MALAACGGSRRARRPVQPAQKPAAPAGERAGAPGSVWRAVRAPRRQSRADSHGELVAGAVRPMWRPKRFRHLPDGRSPARDRGRLIDCPHESRSPNGTVRRGDPQCGYRAGGASMPQLLVDRTAELAQ
jgi:hypothetical protein